MNQTSRINPDQAILLVMDYQNGIVKSIANHEQLLQEMSKLIQFARGAGIKVGFVRVAFEDDDYAAVPHTNKSFRTAADNKLYHDSSPDTQIHEDLDPQPDDIVVHKTRVSAFSTTDLDKQLRAHGIDTLLLAGLVTSGVVLSTVIDAADRDYRIFVIEDLTADRDQHIHDTLINDIFPKRAQVIKADEVPDLFKAE